MVLTKRRLRNARKFLVAYNNRTNRPFSKHEQIAFIYATHCAVIGMKNAGDLSQEDILSLHYNARHIKDGNLNLVTVPEEIDKALSDLYDEVMAELSKPSTKTSIALAAAKGVAIAAIVIGVVGGAYGLYTVLKKA